MDAERQQRHVRDADRRMDARRGLDLVRLHVAEADVEYHVQPTSGALFARRRDGSWGAPGAAAAALLRPLFAAAQAAAAQRVRAAFPATAAQAEG
jgi:hypothetical protein